MTVTSDESVPYAKPDSVASDPAVSVIDPFNVTVVSETDEADAVLTDNTGATVVINL